MKTIVIYHLNKIIVLMIILYTYIHGTWCGYTISMYLEENMHFSLRGY